MLSCLTFQQLLAIGCIPGRRHRPCQEYLPCRVCLELTGGESSPGGVAVKKNVWAAVIRRGVQATQRELGRTGGLRCEATSGAIDLSPNLLPELLPKSGYGSVLQRTEPAEPPRKFN